MAKKTTYHNMALGELVKSLTQKREELRVLRFSSAGSRPKDSSEPHKLRKEIARIMTELSTHKKS